jgi:hypothetical protein
MPPEAAMSLAINNLMQAKRSPVPLPQARQESGVFKVPPPPAALHQKKSV